MKSKALSKQPNQGHIQLNDGVDDKKSYGHNAENTSSRRQALQFMGALAASSSLSLIATPQIANAGKPEIDSISGQLFSPKNEMLGGGGSDMARGIQLQSRTSTRMMNPNSYQNSREFSKSFAKGEGLLQPIYETRFITYLSRFLLNFDSASRSWWESQAKTFTTNGKMSVESQQKLRFAEFAESVEVGRADYFTGPYGSYASVQAGK